MAFILHHLVSIVVSKHCVCCTVCSYMQVFILNCINVQRGIYILISLEFKKKSRKTRNELDKPVKQATNKSPQDTWTIVTPDCPSRNLGTHISSNSTPFSAASEETFTAFLLESQMIIRPPPVTPVFSVLPDATCTTSESCWGSVSFVGELMPPPQWYTTYWRSGGLKSGSPSRITDAELVELVR